MEFFGLFQRYPTDRAYFIAKEILMTERTYKKDLEVLNLVSPTYFLNACINTTTLKVIHGEVDLASILLFVDNGNCWLSISYSIRRKSHVKVKHSFHLNVLDYINNWTKTPLLQGTFYRLPRSKSPGLIFGHFSTKSTQLELAVFEFFSFLEFGQSFFKILLVFFRQK